MLTPHQSKALDYKKHISLTANAGSGKTFVLSKRYLEIAINENIPLRNIAAITFTDKAAGELYQKIAREIDERIKDSKEKSVIEQLEQIRRQLVSANISTIHSFCVNILREHPVEAGVDANFAPIDEIFADELIELSVEEVTRSSLEESPTEKDIKSLIRLFSSKQIFSRELASSIKHRRNLLNLASTLYSKSVDEIAKEFYKNFLLISSKILNDNIPFIIDLIKKINSVVLKSSPSNAIAKEIVSILTKLETEKKTENIISLLDELKNKILTKGGSIAIRGYLNRDDGLTLQNECFQVEDFLGKLSYFEIPANHVDVEIELANVGKTFIHFFNKSLDLYNEKKREAGYLDYEDILLFTQAILENEDVRNSLSEKFEYIMIDEYQDTNELQYNIFLPILDYLKKGNLFVVGDEKQGIYMFRDAELEIFNKTKHRITEKDGMESLLSLPDSFRMAPHLCLFINSLFKELFENPNPLFNEVGHSDLVCARGDEINGNIEILLAESSEEEDEEAAEANLLTERILNLKYVDSAKGKTNWGDVAVLCRKRKSFIKLEKFFVKKGIPYSIIGGKGFYQRQSIYDIYNYFSFLLDQNDDTALVGILRSPFFSVSDSEIFEISLQQAATFWLKLKFYSLEKPTFIQVVGSLEENISLVSKIEVSFLLRKIISETGYLSVLTRRISSTQEQANIEKLIKLTINFFADGFRTLYDYVDYLRDAINEVEDESQAVISDEINSVKIMTIHQAKGLEFPIVFLYRCGEASKKPFIKTKSISVNKNFGLLMKVPLNEDYFSEYHSAPIVGLSDYIGERKNTAEIKRLFYVGTTRAKNQLFISASLKSAVSSKRDSFMRLLQEGLSINYDSAKKELKSELKFLIKKDERYIGFEKDLEIEIPIIRSLAPLVAVKAMVEKSTQKKNLLTNNIIDQPFGEIISATKLSVFKQCPLKYRLIYELGFSSLMMENRNWLNAKKIINTAKLFDFNSVEEEFLAVSNEEELPREGVKLAQMKGMVIHKLLSEEITEAELVDKVEVYLKNIAPKDELFSEQIKKLKSEIICDMVNYYKSKNYEYVKKFQNYKNEYEIYHQHFDYYLYGILDKLIITQNKIIIVDYKTDSIIAEELYDRASQYFTQLKFYAFIVSKLLEPTQNIELRIIFILHPDKFLTLEIKPSDSAQTKQDIEQMMQKIRGHSFGKNLEHCQFCVFSIKGNCIVA